VTGLTAAEINIKVFENPQLLGKQSFQPEMMPWNFNEGEDPVPHLLHVNGDASQPLIDSRIGKVLETID